MKKPKRMWVVMKAHNWEYMTVMGLPLTAPPEGPHRFIPIFNTREQAIKWNNGSEEHVREIEEIPK